MYKKFRIKPPFFEIGPKAYIYGEEALQLALAADRVSRKYDVSIIYTPQYVDIKQIADATENILVFAQHMDPLEIGRGIGSVLPEAVRTAGAAGVLLNHAEKKMTMSDIRKTVKRADEVGLATLVCADNLEEALAIVQFEPNIILAEPESMIGKAGTNVNGRSYVKDITERIRRVNPDIQVLHGAGISNEKDVYDIIKLGAEATGCTSAIIKAANPAEVMDKMISALRRAWDETHPQK